VTGATFIRSQVSGKRLRNELASFVQEECEGVRENIGIKEGTTFLTTDGEPSETVFNAEPGTPA
jgi:hypothetical protein